jgi:hypothetical protein
MKKIIFIIVSTFPTIFSAQGFPPPPSEKPDGKKLELINVFIQETYYHAMLKNFLSSTLSTYYGQYSHADLKKVYEQFKPDEFLKNNQAFYGMFKNLSLDDINKINNLYRSLEGRGAYVPMISGSLISQLNSYVLEELKKQKTIR